MNEEAVDFFFVQQFLIFDICKKDVPNFYRESVLTQGLPNEIRTYANDLCTTIHDLYASI